MKATLILEDGTKIEGTLGECRVKRDTQEIWSDGTLSDFGLGVGYPCLVDYAFSAARMEITLEGPINVTLPSASVLERKEDSSPPLHG